MKLSDLNLKNMIYHYNINEDVIRKYIARQKGDIVEEMQSGTDNNTILGIGVGLFIFLLLLIIGLYLWMFIAFGYYFSTMPIWAIILIIIIFFFVPLAGPIVILLIIYLTKGMGRQGKLGI
jgi:hypothetical protein